MHQRSPRFLLILIFCSLTLPLHSFAEPKKIRPVAEEIGQVPRASRLSLSNTGTWLAMIGWVNNQRTLMVENLDDKSIKPYLVQGPGWRLNWFRWLVDDRLVASISIPQDVDGIPITVTRLALVDPIKHRTRIMFERDTTMRNYQIQDRVVSLTPNEPDSILVSFNPAGPGKPQVRRAILSKRSLSKKRVQKHLTGIQHWKADRNGVVRVGTGFTTDQKQPVLKMKGRDDVWQNFPELAKNLGFSVLGLPTNNLDLVFVSSNHEHTLGALYEFNIATRSFGRKLAQNDLSAISHIELNDAKDTITAIHYSSELVEAEYLDPWLKKFNGHLAKMLPNTNNILVSAPDNGKRAIIYASKSNIDPHFYLYDAEQKSLDFLVSSYPALQGKALAQTELTQYQARDGLTISAYVTLPTGTTSDSAQQLPFVVLPHGGPHARDLLRFDWLVQLIASQGYGVLQMNFRGSTGYGADFLKSGKKQWGQAMQDDITDGTLWLVKQGWADSDRICIAGASYGGYAALMGVVKEPDLYQCAIGLNGVYDLPDLVSTQYNYIGGRFSSSFIGKLWADRKSLRKNSPARHASAINAPVLLIHGKKDRVVSYQQSRTMRDALAKTNVQHQLIELPRGDHYLSNESNRLTFAKAATDFLNTHLGEK